MPRTIEREEVQKLLSEGGRAVEVLSEEQYRELHLPGAVNLPLKELDEAARNRLDPSTPLIVYCWDSA